MKRLILKASENIHKVVIFLNLIKSAFYTVQIEKKDKVKYSLVFRNV